MNGVAPKGRTKWRKILQKTLILAFEVIMQPRKIHLLTFSKVQKPIMEKKSETKIMKITHSASSTSLISQRRNQLISSLTTQKLVNPLLSKNGPDATRKDTTSSNLQLGFSTQSKIPFNSIISTKSNLTLSSSERYEIFIAVTFTISWKSEKLKKIFIFFQFLQ